MGAGCGTTSLLAIKINIALEINILQLTEENAPAN